MSVEALTQDKFESYTKEEGVIVVDFWADWCAPCRAMKPVVESLASEFPGQVKVGLVNVDDEIDLAGEQSIASLPHIKVFKNGEVVEDIIGSIPPVMLKQKVSQHL